MKIQKKYETVTVLIPSDNYARLKKAATASDVSISALASGMVAVLSADLGQYEDEQNDRVQDARELIAEIPRLKKPVARLTPAIVGGLDRATQSTLMDPQTIIEEACGAPGNWVGGMPTFHLDFKNGWPMGYMQETMEFWLETGKYPKEIEGHVRRLMVEYENRWQGNHATAKKAA